MASRRIIEQMQRFAIARPITEGMQQADSNFYQQVQRGSGVHIGLSVLKDPASFDGMPMWLATGGRPSLGRLVPWPLWSESARLDMARTLLEFLEGVGRPERQRTVRTQTTLAIMRSLSGEEWERLTPEFHDANPILLNGGIVEILSENWPGRLATRPCENPTRKPDPDVPGALGWTAIDCGACAPCIDRKTIETERQRVAREAAEQAEQKRLFLEFLQTEEGQAWLTERGATAEQMTP